MHHSDDHPPMPSRPGVHAASPDAGRDRPRIIGALDAMEQNRRARKSRAGRLAWAFFLALLAATAVAGALWYDGEAGKQIVIARSEPPSAAMPGAQPAPFADVAGPAKSERAEAGPGDAAAPLPAAPMIRQADVRDVPPVLDAPRAKARPVSKAASVKRPSKKAQPNNRKRPKSAAALRKEMAPRVESAVAADNDVALLSALVEHTKATQPGVSALGMKLKKCRTLRTPAEASACRMHACAGAGRAATACGGAARN